MKQEETKKVCGICGLEKPLSDFYNRSSRPMGVQSECKVCVKLRSKKQRVKMKAVYESIPVTGTKLCSDCGVEKSSSEFQIAKDTKSGLRSHCKECDKNRRAAKSKKLRQSISIPDKKTCTGCCLEKSKDDFDKRILSKDGLNSKCKECSKKLAVGFKSKTKEYRIVNYYPKLKKWRLEHRGELYTKHRLWVEQNRGRYRELGKNYNNKKYRENVDFRIRINLKNRISIAIKNGAKSGTTIQLLGCTIPEFKKYFEAKFTVGMSWEKFKEGAIVIDHIIPCKLFNMSDPTEQKMCFYSTNLQPLWKLDNLKKGARLTWNSKQTMQDVLRPFHAVYYELLEESQHAQTPA